MTNIERIDKPAKSNENIKRHAHDAVSVYLFNSERTHILLLFHRKLQAWLPPGGHADKDAPQYAAFREVAEETGLENLSLIELDSGELFIESPDQQQLNIDETIGSKKDQVTRPFAIIREKIPASIKESEHIHIDYVYVGHINASDQSIRIDLRESEDQQWFPLTPQALESLKTFHNVKAILGKLYELRQSSSI